MSKNTLSARVDALEIALARIESGIEALVEANQPAKRATPARRAAAKKTTQPKAAAKATKKADTPAKALTRKNRAEFVKAHAWAQGLSTTVIAHMAVEDPSLLAAGWRIGERRAAMCA